MLARIQNQVAEGDLQIRRCQREGAAVAALYYCSDESRSEENDQSTKEIGPSGGGDRFVRHLHEEIRFQIHSSRVVHLFQSLTNFSKSSWDSTEVRSSKNFFFLWQSHTLNSVARVK